MRPSSCGHVTQHGATWIWSGNTPALIGVAICLLLLIAWWEWRMAEFKQSRYDDMEDE